ncbi:ABC transporter permease subunit, partial [Pseudomonadota bacterium]
MNISSTKTIVKKELKSFLNSPTAYIVLIIFLLLWEFLFFRNVFLFGEASLRILMGLVPWLFILLIPALTMGSISEENSTGTLEILLTHPVGLVELVIGKFIASLLFVTASLAFLFPIAYSLNRYGSLDWGVVFGQFFASVLLAGVIVSLGIFVSSLFTSQIASLLVSSTVTFLLIISGFEIVTLSLPPSVASIFEKLSLLTHFESMSRGVIDIRDIFYFLSAIIIFISLAYLQILKIRIGNQKTTFRQHQLGISLFVVIAVLLNIVGSRIPGRIDLTQNNIYTLSDATISTVSNLDDVVNIKLFATTELPAQLRPILRD